jgi:hypothetical protein
LTASSQGLAFDDFAGFDAAGAGLDPLGVAVGDGLDGLQVGVPAPTGDVVGVRDVVAELRSLAAKITYLCHDDRSVNQTFDAESRELHARQASEMAPMA